MHIALLRMQAGSPGGAEATLEHLARGLAAAGHQVTVYGAGSSHVGAKSLGAEVTFAPVPVWGGKTLRLLSFAANTRRLLHKAPVDVVLSLERTFFQQVYRAGDGCHREWLARRSPSLSRGKKLGQTFSPFHRVMLWLEKRTFTSPALKRVIANSRQVKEEVSRHFRLHPDMVRLIYNGLDHQVFQPPAAAERRRQRERLGASAEHGIILFAGSGFARKGLKYLVEAFGRLADKQAHLWVVGKGRAGSCQSLARQLGVADRVRFWGPQTEMAPFYQAADLLALPTLYDPCSNVVLEALGCGCPVITSAANGAAEFITPGENGEVIPQPDDGKVWAGSLDEWLARSRDPRVSRAAREAVAHLSWEATVSRTLEVLQDAVAFSCREKSSVEEKL
jgi:UDP-glucose:(heptosyl)LPS alpha-1,3-glucosyltransferase